MQKFKLLATQCSIMNSPTRSPASSPVIHLRRRKTLRTLLSRGSSSRRLKELPDPPKKLTNVSHKLKDLFVSTSYDDAIPDQKNSRSVVNSGGGGPVPSAGGGNNGVTAAFAHTPPRPLSATFRQRLMRRPFRPVLVAIPE
ncbi:uncharacterized protein LOC124916655 [Impatiens glandulifera]|uniref:uncharacterized protein LOC124916655 n=1 Tax=Impatiens glandulifera TaxID=253017 RepID=UPI001FB147FB|nr:uncharacterized protein LOC124916655 [Impatiens glandulifera]